MPKKSFSINTNLKDFKEENPLIFSTSSFKANYLFGIPLCVQGKTPPPEIFFETQIKAAQQYFENMLQIKFKKQTIEESQDYSFTEYMSWGIIKTTFPVSKSLELKGRYGETEVLSYPSEWLSTKVTNNEASHYRQITIIPNASTKVSFSGNFINQYTGYSHGMMFSTRNSAIIPNFWLIKYETGFDKIPFDLRDVVGKLASVSILTMLNESTAIGGSGMFGMASSSLSLDGLSQSVSKMNGGDIFGKRAKAYLDEIKEYLPTLKNIYYGYTLSVA